MLLRSSCCPDSRPGDSRVHWPPSGRRVRARVVGVVRFAPQRDGYVRVCVSIASFRVDAYHLGAVQDVPMEVVELASRAVPDLNKARYGTRVDSVHAGLNLPQPFHGEGVLIGVLDWGFDYTHPMFYDTSMTASRIRAVWDQYRQAGPAPGDYGYGTTAETPWEIQLMESDTSNVYGY